MNVLYKSELIHRRAPWKTKVALELATSEWVAWFNHHRLLSSIGYIPLAEAQVNSKPLLVTIWKKLGLGLNLKQPASPKLGPIHNSISLKLEY